MIYWTLTGFAVLMTVVAILAAIFDSADERGMIVGYLLVGLFLWLTGRACRYVLAGR